MKRVLVLVGTIAAVASSLAVTPLPSQADNFSIGVNIGASSPPPPMVLAAPPLVVVPGTPVYYAPSLSLNFFAYGGRYYTHHNGAWFVAATSGAPWTFLAVNRVPQPVLAVPASYYKVPPGHMKGTRNHPREAGRGKGHRHKWVD